MTAIAEKLRGEIRKGEKNIAEMKAMLSELEDNSSPVVVDLKSFLAEPLTFKWMVGGIIAENTIGMLVADPAMGKTTLLAQLTLLLGTGRPFFGHHVEAPYRTLMIAAEGSRAAFRNRVDSARKTLGIEESCSDWFIHADGHHDFDFASAAFERMVSSSGARFVVADTIGYFAPGMDENSATEWKKRVMIPLRTLSEKYKTTFCLVHHQTKESEYRKGAQKTRGTSAMFADLDFHFQLEPVDGPGNELRRALFVRKNKYGSAGHSIGIVLDAIGAVFSLDRGAA